MDVGGHSLDEPTTPKPHHAFFHPGATSYDDDESLITPTRDTFHMSPSSTSYPPIDAALGASSYSHHSLPSKSHVDRAASLRSARSGGSGDAGDASMAGDDPDQGAEDSEDEGTVEDGDKAQKKKKGQRFYCTDYPPCNLSFTRSEHLARHIRKHTGERPFQCHCLRRFSRLDNLRQHAQTVHLNEDIPTDSLAATGARFQRQVRTERVRASGGRSRASTLGSQAPPPPAAAYQRGHSRNFSGSSIGSIASDFTSAEDSHARHHHHSLAAAHLTPSRNGLTLDTFGGAQHEQSYYPYFPQNNHGYSSPTHVYSADPNSPVAHAGLQSPIAMEHHHRRMNNWHEPSHIRRMSVPSTSAIYHQQQHHHPHLHHGQQSSYGSNPSSSSYMSPVASSSNTSSYSNTSSIMTSPASSIFPDPHQEHPTEAELRRRTWHPGTYGGYGPNAPRPATSGLSYYQTPDSPKPVPTTQSAAAQNVRLPGIDSFLDRSSQRPAQSSYQRAMSPMDVDTPSPRHSHEQQSMQPPAIDTSNRLTAPHRSLHVSTRSAPQSLETVVREMNSADGSSPVTPRRQKREAWYNGPLTGSHDTRNQPAMLRNSPGGSSPGDVPHTPSGNTVDYHPAIIHSNGFVEPAQSEDSPKINEGIIGHAMATGHSHDPYTPTRRNNDMDRLDALVAVATSESQAADR